MCLTYAMLATASRDSVSTKQVCVCVLRCNLYHMEQDVDRMERELDMRCEEERELKE